MTLSPIGEGADQEQCAWEALILPKSFDDLQNGVVLAELGGHGDGPYCAQHGKGAALVMLGTYIVDHRDNLPYPAHFVFKPGRTSYASYLKKHVAAARAAGAKVGVSVISVTLADTVDFLQAAEEAGADVASLCSYSEMDMFTSENLGVELCRPDNRDRLTEWASAIVQAVRIPVIFKIGFDSLPETAQAIQTMTDAGVPIVHLAIGNCDPDSEGLKALEPLANCCDLLIAGGGVTDVESARRILAAGAGAVAVASAAMKDPALCGRIQRQLRSR